MKMDYYSIPVYGVAVDKEHLLTRIINMMDSPKRITHYWGTVEMARMLCMVNPSHKPTKSNVYSGFKRLETLGITELVDTEEGKKWKLTKDHKRKLLLLDAVKTRKSKKKNVQ